MTTVTEAQKKQIMVLLVLFITLLMYIQGIRPMQATIKENEVNLVQIEAERQQMQSIVDNRTIEPEYVKLREEYETKFQLRFDNFNINEKIEAIAKELDVSLISMKIQGFESIPVTVYENYIAQPKTMEELDEIRAGENSPVFPLLLSSRVDIDLEVTGLEQELRVYDAFNNIVPVGPGDSDPDRNCILMPTMKLVNLRPINDRVNSAASTKVSYTVYVFAMETMDLSEWDAEFEARK